MHRCKEPWVDDRGFCSAAGVWTQQQQITRNQPVATRVQKGLVREFFRGQNLPAHSAGNVICSWKHVRLLQTQPGLYPWAAFFFFSFKLMSWECPFFPLIDVVSPSAKRERKEWGKRHYTWQWDETQKWIDTRGNKRRKWEARYKLWKRGDNSSDTRKLRAICGRIAGSRGWVLILFGRQGNLNKWHRAGVEKNCDGWCFFSPPSACPA